MTHVLQTLDVTCFSPLKKQIELLSHHWHGDPANAGKKLDQYKMMYKVAFQAVEKVFGNPEVVKSGFRKTGIFPWNKIKPDVRKLQAGKIYKRGFDHDNVFPFPPGSSNPGQPSASASSSATSSNAAPSTTIAPSIPVPFVGSVVPEALSPAPMIVATDTNQNTLAPTFDCSPMNPGITDYAAEDISPATASSSSSSVPVSRECSASSTATLPSSSNPSVALLVAEQEQLSYEDKQDMLKRFELLISSARRRMFEDLYSQNIKDVPNTEYQTWLLYKMQSVGTEKEALDRVLSSRIPKDVPKKETTRKSDLPTGDDRYNPLSAGYYEYFDRVEARKGKRKITATSPPPLLAPEPSKKPRKKPQNTGQ